MPINGKQLIHHYFKNMKVEIKDKKLIGILEKREEVHKEIGVIMEQLMALDKEKTKLGYKMDRLKEKTKVIIDKKDIEVDEFNIISRVLLEDGKAYCEIIDLVEEYKQALREKK
jgi:hypothetical protein